MAPSRGKGKSRTAGGRSAQGMASRSTKTTRSATLDVYEEMLVEEAKRSPEVDLPGRPLKRRRVATGVRTPTQPVLQPESTPPLSSPAPSLGGGKAKGKARAKPVQTIEASSNDGSGNESDLAFEDIDLDGTAGSASAAEDDGGIADVSISVDPSNTAKPRAQVHGRRATSAEKALRLLTHKAHVLCLLGHGVYVNTWCNDTNAQQHLHPLLSKKTLTCLQGKEEHTQFQRDRCFREGLEQASDVFRAHFKVNASGMRRSISYDNGEEADPTDDIGSTSRQDLITAARDMEGSQDIGNQLFCALLRSAGVDARLVFSMQPVSLTSVQSKNLTPQKQKSTKPVVRVMPPYADPATSDSNTEDSAVKSSSTVGNVPSARRRLGQPTLQSAQARPTLSAPSTRKKPVRKLDYPIFWVEAFNTAHQKWTPVDPSVTRTTGKPSKFEPPSSYTLNKMSYVIAFEEDGVVRDVTRRYTKAYNAKTRRNRVESTENGMQWYKNALRVFRRRGGFLDREQTEDAELNQKEAREGLPGNVQDFKDHPVYALERHLKRSEIIEPKREVGKVNAGTAAKPRLEAVYRRSDVLVCRSADKWYRLGREIQKGEAPIKHVPARNPGWGRSLTPDADAGEAAGAGMTALYAQYQTEAYVAPPVVKGKVPRNTFGNLDIYVPSMVPPGGTHIRHALAQQAAKILRVDYADAVTGFQFKGRHGTAIVQGAVVPSQHAEAVEAIIDGLQNEQLESDSLARSAVALKMWKRFLTGLRIKERVSAYGTYVEANNVREQIDREVDEQDEIAGAGGFFAEEPAMPTAGKFSLVEMNRAAKQTPANKRSKRKEKSESESEEAEFSGAETEGEERNFPARRSKRVRTVVHGGDEEEDGDSGMNAGPSVVRTSDDSALSNNDGGGFLSENAEDTSGDGGIVPEGGESELSDGAGGFVPEEAGGGGGFLPDVDDDTPANNSAANEDGGGFQLAEERPGTQTGGFLPESNERAGMAVAVPSATSPTMEASDGNVLLQANHTNGDHPSPDESLSMHGALPNEQATGGKGSLLPAEMDVDQPDINERDPKAGQPDLAAEDADEGATSDHGSMLSHDPEDEDAEPDWLESD